VSTPDLAGFVDAQHRLRDVMGVDAVFIHTGARTYAAGVPMNPRTGRPYDPFTAPDTEVPETRETVRCGKFSRFTRQGATTDTPIGFMADADLILTFDLADLPRVQGADRVEVEGEVWKLRATDEDSIGQRGVAYLEHA
jgi:hypothetical protein